MNADRTVNIAGRHMADRYRKMKLLSLAVALSAGLFAAQSALSGEHSVNMTNYYSAPKPSKYAKAPAPNRNLNYRPGSISGVIWWDTTRVQRSLGSMHPAGGFGGLSTSGCVGLAVSASMQSQPVGMVRYLGYSQAGTIAKCAYEIDQVPVGANLTVSDRVQQSMFKTPVAAFSSSPYFKIPGGTCNRAISPSMPYAGIATCGNRASNVNLQLVAISSVPQPR